MNFRIYHNGHIRKYKKNNISSLLFAQNIVYIQDVSKKASALILNKKSITSHFLRVIYYYNEKERLFMIQKYIFKFF